MTTGQEAAIIGEVAQVAVARASEAPINTQEGEEVAQVVATAAAVETSTTAQEEVAREGVATAGAADPLENGAAGRGDTATSRVAAMEGIGATHREVPTELAAPAPWRIAARALSTARPLS